MAYERLVIPVGGGLNETDNPDLLAPGEATVLRDFVASGAGRLAPRKAAREVLAGITGDVVGVFPFPVGTYGTGGEHRRGGVVLGYSAGTTTLYSVDRNGQNLHAEGTLWTGGSARPRVTAGLLNRALWLTDESRTHGLARFNPAHETPILQPTFSFTDAAAAKAFPRIVTPYNNMLVVAGYGTEVDTDRPEVVRFSYLGLVDDEQGAGDAGSSASAGIFDREDYFMVGERGAPVVSAAAALGRLLICTPYATYSLFGYDRTSFQLELVDNQRGSVSTLGVIAAAGYVWGWGVLGPWRWRGAMEDLSYKIRPRLPLVGTQQLFAAHAPDAREVRWYYAENSEGDPRKYVAFNYETNTWAEGTTPAAVFCFGSLSPFWSKAVSGESTGAPEDEQVAGAPPAGAPTALTFPSVWARGARARWSPGSTAPGTETEVEMKRTADASWALAGAPLPAGTVAVNLAAEPSTDYDVRVRHKMNGQYSAYATGTFTTPAESAPPSALLHFDAEDEPSPDTPAVLVSWQLPAAGLYARIYRKPTSGGTWEVVHEARIDATSWWDYEVEAYTSYDYKARAVAAGEIESADSATVTVIPSVYGGFV